MYESTFSLIIRRVWSIVIQEQQVVSISCSTHFYVLFCSKKRDRCDHSLRVSASLRFGPSTQSFGSGFSAG